MMDATVPREKTRLVSGREERRESKVVGKEVFASEGKVVGSGERRGDGLEEANRRARCQKLKGENRDDSQLRKGKGTEGRRRS